MTNIGRENHPISGLARVVAYYPELAGKVGGVKAALLLSQLLYWSQNPHVQQRSGWVYKTVEDLERETGLSKTEQQTARRVLCQAGVLSARLKGIPRVWYYHVNRARLDELCAPSPRAATPQAATPRAATPPGSPAPDASPLDDNPLDDGQETRPPLGQVAAQLNKESKTTAQITPEIAGVPAPAGVPASIDAPAPKNPQRSSKRKTPAGSADLTAHPAILLVRDVTGRRPHRAVCERVIRDLGDCPDRAKFARVYEAWCARGYNPANLEGQLDWYRSGIPPHGSPGSAGPSVRVRQPSLPPSQRAESERAELREQLRAIRQAR